MAYLLARDRQLVPQEGSLLFPRVNFGGVQLKSFSQQGQVVLGDGWRHMSRLCRRVRC